MGMVFVRFPAVLGAQGWSEIYWVESWRVLVAVGKNTAAGLIGSDVWLAPTLGNIQTVS
jgi:hypothetical protein